MAIGRIQSSLAQPTQRYTVVDLGQVGAAPGQPYSIAGNGLVGGEIVFADPVVAHAVLWPQGRRKDIGRPGLGGPNSSAFGTNSSWQAVGQADTKTRDPDGEDFCGAKALALADSGNTCVPFLWQNGSMFPLPRLRNSAGKEGSNGQALKINDYGIMAGTSENGELDKTCPGASVSAQRIEFKPVIWTGPLVHVHQLETVDNDPDGIAFDINRLNQVVGRHRNLRALQYD
jgi:uncharacterized membrane protein